MQNAYGFLMNMHKKLVIVADSLDFIEIASYEELNIYHV